MAAATAPPVEDLPADDIDAPPPPPPPPPPVDPTRRRRRRGLVRRLALPQGGVEVAGFALGCFLLYWSTRSWVLTALAAAGWLAVTALYRAWHRRRGAGIAERRLSRERVTALAVVAFVVVGCLAGLRAWSTRFPHIPKADPAGPYVVIGGAAAAAWTHAYGETPVVRGLSQPAAGYWVAVLADPDGCWSQSFVVRGGQVNMAGERTPAPCPPQGYVPSAHGDALDPAHSAPARAASDFVDAWLSEGAWEILTAPGSNVHALGRTVRTTAPPTVYPIAVTEAAATLWVVAPTGTGPVGVQVALLNDKGRWYVKAIAGSPPVEAADVEELPDPTTTSSTTTTTIGGH